MGANKFRLITCPLDSYFGAHPGAKPRPDVLQTHDWKQYEAEWEIQGDSLFITGITVLRFKDGADSAVSGVHSRPFGLYASMPVLDEVFPGRNHVLADWYTGYLVVPIGSEAAGCTEPYPSYMITIYENYIIHVVNDGLVSAQRSLSAEEFCEFLGAQFRAYQGTEKYRKQLSRMSAIHDSSSAMSHYPVSPPNHDYLIYNEHCSDYVGQIYGPTTEED